MITDQEKTILEVFTADTAMYDAVQKIAKGRIEKERDMFIRVTGNRKDKTPLEIGTQVQIFDEALLLVDAVFKDLRQFRKQVDEPTSNPAR